MIKLPEIHLIKKVTNTAFQEKVQKRAELFLQRVAAEVEHAAKQGYCGWSDRIRIWSETDKEEVLAMVEIVRKSCKKQGYYCHYEIDKNSNGSVTGVIFTVSWRTHWFE